MMDESVCLAVITGRNVWSASPGGKLSSCVILKKSKEINTCSGQNNQQNNAHLCFRVTRCNFWMVSCPFTVISELTLRQWTNISVSYHEHARQASPLLILDDWLLSVSAPNAERKASSPRSVLKKVHIKHKKLLKNVRERRSRDTGTGTSQKIPPRVTLALDNSADCRRTKL